MALLDLQGLADAPRTDGGDDSSHSNSHCNGGGSSLSLLLC